MKARFIIKAMNVSQTARLKIDILGLTVPLV